MQQVAQGLAANDRMHNVSSGILCRGASRARTLEGTVDYYAY
jgi:hypothetical protein